MKDISVGVSANRVFLGFFFFFLGKEMTVVVDSIPQTPEPRSRADFVKCKKQIWNGKIVIQHS